MMSDDVLQKVVPARLWDVVQPLASIPTFHSFQTGNIFETNTSG